MVSIIIPVYNVAPYIEACLSSVMRQTYKGAMECIIVDDCGSDESIAIAERMVSSYEGSIRFVILHHSHNRGLSAARNTGKTAAQGEYIYYLDSDDEITDDCIEKLIAPVSKDPDIEMVQGNTKMCSQRRYDPYTKQYPIKCTKSNEEARACFYRKHLILVNAWNKLIKRSFLIQNNLLFKDGLLWEDHQWLFFLLKHVRSIYFVSDVTYIYKPRPGSISTGTDKRTKAKHRAVFFHDVLTYLTPHNERTEMKYIITPFAHYYSRFNKELPEYKNLFSIYWQKAKEHKAYTLNVILAICYILGKTKYGWVVIPFIKRMKHPRYIINDIQRIRNQR